MPRESITDILRRLAQQGADYFGEGYDAAADLAAREAGNIRRGAGIIADEVSQTAGQVADVATGRAAPPTLGQVAANLEDVFVPGPEDFQAVFGGRRGQAPQQPQAPADPSQPGRASFGDVRPVGSDDVVDDVFAQYEAFSQPERGPLVRPEVPTEDAIFDNAINAARDRVQGGAQMQLNPFVESNRPELQKIEREKQVLESLLGKTTNPEQQAELQRVLSVTEDRLAGRTSSVAELYPELAVQSENIARWAARNRRSPRDVQRAMRELYQSQAARTGLSQVMEQKARAAKRAQEELGQFKQQLPDLAPFAYVDQETGRPTVDKASVDSQLKIKQLQAEGRKAQMQTQVELKENADKQVEAYRKNMMELLKPAEGGELSPAEQQEKFNTFFTATNAFARRAYAGLLPEEQLNKMYPPTGQRTFAQLSPLSEAVLGPAVNEVRGIQPIPGGIDPRVYASQQNLRYVSSPDEGRRLQQAGEINSGDQVVTPRGIVIAP